MKKILYILVILILGGKLWAQDPHFSQFYASPLYLSPSFAGTSKTKSRVALNYKNQWPEVDQAFVTYGFSFDHYFSEIRSGIGFLFLRDIAGVGNLSTINIGAQYAYDFRVLEDLHIRPGLHMYYTQRSIDFSKLMFYDELDETIQMTLVAPPEESKADVDFATSVMGYSDAYWGGITVDHMLRANQSLYGEKSLIPVKYSVFGGARIPLKEKLLLSYEESLTAAFLYKQQGDFQQLQLGAYYHKNPLVFGLWYRGIPVFKENPGSDALIFLMGYKIDNLSVGYSYDFTLSSLRNMTGGSHEISLNWNFEIREFKKRPTAVPCPDF